LKIQVTLIDKKSMRLSIVRAHRHWTKEDSKKVVWSDEYAI